jgi:hypothetical protein
MGYKDEIERRVHLPKPGFFINPPKVREYPLYIQNNTGHADFCWYFRKNGKLFVEDEDDGSSRALNNLVKYWRWCDENPDSGPILLIHILGKEQRLNVHNARFLGNKMETVFGSRPFYYRAVTGFVGNDQHDPNARWLNDLESCVRAILPILEQ